MKDWQKEAIEEGIASAERGELTPLDEVKAKWEAAGAVEVGTLVESPHGLAIVLRVAEPPFNDVEVRLIGTSFTRWYAKANLKPYVSPSDFERARAADRAEIEFLRQQISELEEYRDLRIRPKNKVDSLEEEVERLRMQLTACGVVALANTTESAVETRKMHQDYRSSSLEEVERAVDREIAIRAELAEVGKALEQAVDDIESWGAYASDYFQEKHDLSGCVAKYRAAVQHLLSARQQGEEE